MCDTSAATNEVVLETTVKVVSVRHDDMVIAAIACVSKKEPQINQKAAVPRALPDRF